jgi:hypothetical protein
MSWLCPPPRPGVVGRDGQYTGQEVFSALGARRRSAPDFRAKIAGEMYTAPERLDADDDLAGYAARP